MPLQCSKFNGNRTVHDSVRGMWQTVVAFHEEQLKTCWQRMQEACLVHPMGMYVEYPRKTGCLNGIEIQLY